MKKIFKVLFATLSCLCFIISFTSCAPRNVEKAKEKMRDLDYHVVESSMSVHHLVIVLGIADIKAGAEGIIATSFDEVLNVYYFESKSDAKIFFDEWVVPNRDRFYWNNIDQIGKMVCYGTNKAYNDFI